MTLIDWIEANAKEGADISEAKGMIKEMDVLSTIVGAEKAVDFIKSNPELRKGLDSEVSRAVKSHDERFMETKLPEILKEERSKINAELNPKETPEQKRIRELEERIKAQDEKEILMQRKAALREKAKELEYDPIRAERFAAYGDEAEKMLEEDAEWIKSTFDSRLSKQLTERVGGNPRGGGDAPASKRDELIASYNEIEKSSDPNKGAKLIALKDQIAKIPKQ
jgi:hypothetical protein